MTRWPDIMWIKYDEPVRDYWKRRLNQHHNDFYKDRWLMKLPEDLRTYQHLIDRIKPDIILEFGTGFGASAVWFADQLDTFCGGGTVVTIGNHEIPRDLSEHEAFLNDPRIEFIMGDLTSEEVIAKVHELCAGKRVMACEDSAHTRHVTFTALDRYSDLIPAGSWFIVEDGIVDEPEISIWNGTGVQPGIKDFMESEKGKRFKQHHLAFYGITMHFNGYLEAIE
jgi:cephalosporin hydroxylase